MGELRAFGHGFRHLPRPGCELAGSGNVSVAGIANGKIPRTAERALDRRNDYKLDGRQLASTGETLLHSVILPKGYFKRDEAAITSHRVIYVNKGIIGHDILELSLTSVENVTVKQTLFQRLFNRGTIIVGSASGIRDLEISNVPDPIEFRRQAIPPLKPDRARRMPILADYGPRLIIEEQD